MMWIGIGLIIIGIALLALIGVLIKPLTKATAILNDVKKTTENLPETVTDLTSQAKDTLHSGHSIIQEINMQLKELTPIFYIVGDVGRSTRQISSNMVNAVEDFEHKEKPDFVNRKNLEGLYGAITLGALIFQKAKEFSKERKVVDSQ